MSEGARGSYDFLRALEFEGDIGTCLTAMTPGQTFSVVG